MATKESLDVRVRRRVAKQLHDELNTFQTHTCIDDDDPQAKKKGIKPKPESPYSIQNVLWLISSIAVFYWTDFARAIIFDPQIKRTWFNVGVVLVLVNLLIALFLIVYSSWIKKMTTDDWDIHYPAAIPIATASFAFGSFCLTVALWPVWGLLTLPILFVQFMGVVVLIAMLPGSS